jgi:hypothetical protein
MRFFIIYIYLYIYILMSYDKYIKYKNKYLQLKAKYTQVGGAGMWTIFKTEKQPTTTPITKEESDALNAIIQPMLSKQTQEKEINIPSGSLKDKQGNVKGYSYKITINADGIKGGLKGKRTSKNGEYDMIFIPDDTSGASALPQSRAPPPPPPASAPPSSASGVSSAPLYAPPTYSPPSYRSASGAPPQSQRAYPPSTSYRSASGAPPQPQRAYAPSAFGAPAPAPPLSSFKSYGRSGATDASSAPSASAPPSPYQLGVLPSFLTISTIKNLRGEQIHSVLVADNINLGSIPVGDTLKIDNVIFNKVSEQQINMTIKDYTYPLLSTNNPSTWVYNFGFEIKI